MTSLINEQYKISLSKFIKLVHPSAATATAAENAENIWTLERRRPLRELALFYEALEMVKSQSHVGELRQLQK